MYNVSDAYNTAIAARSRTTRIEGTLTLTDGSLTNLADRDIMQGSLNINTSVVTGSDFELGVAALSEMTLAIRTTANRYSLYGAELSFTVYITLADGTEEGVPLGIFTVSSAERKGNVVSIEAYDNMSKFGKTFTTGTIGTPYEILVLLCDTCGVEFGNTQSEIDAMSALDSSGNVIKLTTVDNDSFSTYRDVVATIAATLGGFAVIDRTGKLVIKRFGASTVTLANSQVKKRAICDYVKRYSAVEITAGETVHLVGDDTGETLKMKDCLLDVGLTETQQQLANNILGIVNGISYTPATLTCTGNPAIDAGDAVTFTDVNGSDEYTTYVMKTNWNYKGKHDIEAVGANPILSSSKKDNSNTGGVSQSVKNAIQDSAYSVSAFLSSSKFSVGRTGVYIYNGDISSKSTTALVVGQISIDVTKCGTFQWWYELNGEKLLFEPKQVLTYQGFHVLPIFAVLSDMSTDTINTLSIGIISEDGEATIWSKGIYISISSSGIGSDAMAFKGYVKLREMVGPVEGFGLEILPFTDSVSHGEKTPVGNAIEDSIGEIAVIGFEVSLFDATPTSTTT